MRAGSAHRATPSRRGPAAMRVSNGTNGVSVGFSRWVDLLPDGTPLEGRGVVPARALEQAGPGDPTFAAGLGILEEMVRR